MIFYTIYTSKSRKRVSTELLEEITASATLKNRQKGITGILLGLENQFLQYLEGDRVHVSELMKIIKKDERHYDVHQWIQGYTDDRVFSEWGMCSWLLTNETLEQLKAIREIETFLLKAKNSPVQSKNFLKMMKSLLQIWIAHQPERESALKSYLSNISRLPSNK